MSATRFAIGATAPQSARSAIIFDIASPNGVMCHLKALEKKGLITREPNMSRAIQLSQEPAEERGLPMTGRIAAGVLHEAIEQDERLDLEAMFHRKKNLFALSVSGDSMIDAQIADGDYVIVRKQRTARDGQIVVAETDEGEATLKRWYQGKEPHPARAGQFHDEADLRQRRPHPGRGRRRGAAVGVSGAKAKN